MLIYLGLPKASIQSRSYLFATCTLCRNGSCFFAFMIGNGLGPKQSLSVGQEFIYWHNFSFKHPVFFLLWCHDGLLPLIVDKMCQTIAYNAWSVSFPHCRTPQELSKLMEAILATYDASVAQTQTRSMSPQTQGIMNPQVIENMRKLLSEVRKLYLWCCLGLSPVYWLLISRDCIPREHCR